MRDALRSLVVLLGATLAACSAPAGTGARTAPWPPALDEPRLRPQRAADRRYDTGAPFEIERAARFLSEQHVTPVDGDVLLAAALRALHESAGGGEPLADLPHWPVHDAVVRLRGVRPELQDEEIVALAVGAMARTLGDDASFLTPEEAAPFTRPPGRRAGAGLVVKRDGEVLRIVRVIPGGPAASAGLTAGEALRAIDGRPTDGLPLHDAAALLTGLEGTELSLELASGTAPQRSVVVRRALVDQGAADCRVLDGRILYLSARSLSKATVAQVREHAGRPAVPTQAVILDLRANPGGLLDAARDLADLFLADGPILSIAGRGGVEAYAAHPDASPLERARVVVLVDAGTGSGAEAVAAAIQDSRRGPVLGARTSARARIDVAHRTPGGGILKVLKARLLRARGDPIDGHGVVPDVEVPEGAAAPPLASDVACPGFSSPALGGDPAVAGAAALLSR